jgi:hypothetical protein
MKWLIAIALAAELSNASASGLMDDCQPGDRSMKCINRNGVCVAVTIDAQATQPIGKAQRERILRLPDMRDVCWQLATPVSAQFRVQARGGGLQPDFIGPVDSLGVLVVPIDDYDPEFDHSRIDPLYDFSVDADGYRDGTWQLKRSDHFSTGKGPLKAGEYVVVIRVHGRDNWDKQAVLLRVDPALAPAPAQQGTPNAKRAKGDESH